jgi:hypothetical protein
MNSKSIDGESFVHLLQNSGVYLLDNSTGKAHTLNFEEDIEELQFFEACAPGPMSDPSLDLRDVNDEGLGHLVKLPEKFETAANGTILINLPKKTKKGWVESIVPHTLLVEVSLEECKKILAARLQNNL